MKTWKKFLLSLPAATALFYILLFIFEIREANLHPEQYNFGGEAMIGNGGEHYRSQESYVSQMKKYAAGSSLLFIVLTAGAFFINRRKKRSTKL